MCFSICYTHLTNRVYQLSFDPVYVLLYCNQSTLETLLDIQRSCSSSSICRFFLPVTSQNYSVTSQFRNLNHLVSLNPGRSLHKKTSLYTLSSQECTLGYAYLCSCHAFDLFQKLVENCDQPQKTKEVSYKFIASQP